MRPVSTGAPVNSRSIVAALLMFSASSSAFAQDEPVEPTPAPSSASVMEFNTLLIAPVQPMDPALAEEAKRVGQLLSARLGETNIAFSIDDVPRFETQDYSAETYVLACPPGKYSGCALVVGQRAPADWVVGGTLNYTPEALLEETDQFLLTVYFIDVKDSREVVNFAVVVGGANDDQEVVGGIASMYDKIVQGAMDEIDVRGEVLDPKVEAELKRRRAQIAAASLLELEEQLGDVVITAPGEIEPQRVTRASLKEFDNREDTAPWIKLGMTEGQYLRYRNTGLELGVYRRRIRGRLGQILARVSFGGGNGPWGMHHEARNAVGFVDSQFLIVQVDQFQELRQSSFSALTGELGFGVAPFLEVAFVIGTRTAPFTYVFDQDEVGDPSFVDAAARTPGNTSQFGGHVTFAPLPLRQLRPMVTLGMMGWKGKTIPVDDPYTRLLRPNMLLLQAGPGVEASAGRYLNLFVRGLLDLPLTGTYFDSNQAGTVGNLQNLQVPVGNYGPGFMIQGGFQLRISLLGDPGDEVENFFEEEEEGL